ncbi:MAG: CoB--CoM heterodisulfide reductase iron-sulfur subunit A family protein [Candidatus Lokiarchaeota archaeon]|nr:CoB--CoM heterodisulfide reductase iron-sulfur subunit A family protein [Candidatus Harpocratesius repetitus]
MKKKEETRIGVFICHCGTNIGGILDVPSLTEYAKTLDNVVFTQRNLYTCSETGLSAIKKGIKENNLNRVVVAACTPRTHEPLFQGICKEMGLNPYFFEFVNIREQCSWVHQMDHEKATSKARDLIRMGVARASLLEALEKHQIDVEPSALVIGGGISGMSAAEILANQGFQTIIVEKKPQLGGQLLTLHKLFPNNMDPEQILRKRDEILSNPLIKVYTSSEISSIEGYIGNFDIKIQSTEKEKGEESKQERSVKVGAIIVATGSDVLKPEGYYNYDGKRVITQKELEELLKQDQFTYQKIVMIQCVGSRIPERPYCSTICCMTAMKNARIIKKNNPETEIFILNRDIYTSGTYQEEFYRDTRKEGIIFSRYDEAHPPEVTDHSVIYYNFSQNGNIEIECDLVVLSTPLIPYPESESLSKMLKVPIDEYGFFLEAHIKLRPVDFSNDGIFVCGTCRWPGNIPESISQGYAAASRASRILKKGKFSVEGGTAWIDQDKCIQCEVCLKKCNYKAISRDEDDKVVVTAVLCKGCGACATTCPEHAIVMRHFTDNQIESQIAALLEGTTSD